MVCYYNYCIFVNTFSLLSASTLCNQKYLWNLILLLRFYDRTTMVDCTPIAGNVIIQCTKYLASLFHSKTVYTILLLIMFKKWLWTPTKTRATRSVAYFVQNIVKLVIQKNGNIAGSEVQRNEFGFWISSTGQPHGSSGNIEMCVIFTIFVDKIILHTYSQE